MYRITHFLTLQFVILAPHTDTTLRVPDPHLVLMVLQLTDNAQNPPVSQNR